jgi:hypothetical protein
MKLASSQGGEGSSAVNRLVSFARSNFMAIVTARQLQKKSLAYFFLAKATQL